MSSATFGSKRATEGGLADELTGMKLNIEGVRFVLCPTFVKDKISFYLLKRVCIIYILGAAICIGW